MSEPTWQQIVTGQPLPPGVALSAPVAPPVPDDHLRGDDTRVMPRQRARERGEAEKSAGGEGAPAHAPTRETSPTARTRTRPRRSRGIDLPGLVLPRFTHQDDMSKAALRRGFAIHAYVGSNGGGKTLAMVHDTLPSLMDGRRVLSTVRLLDYRDPRPCPGGSRCDDPEHHDITETIVDVIDLPDFPPGNRLGIRAVTRPTGRVHRAAHPLYVPFVKFGQLLDFRHGDVLMDEVTGVASSRQSQTMPAEVLNLLNQLRRRDVMLRWTAPSWSRADVVIREVTQAVTDCSGMHAVTRYSDDGTARTWRDRRLFHWWTYDTRAYDAWTSRKAEQVDPWARQRFWRPDSVAEATYDTLDGVSQLGSVTESGRCGTCGGRRSAPACTCADHGGAGEASAPRARSRSKGGGSTPVQIDGERHS